MFGNKYLTIATLALKLISPIIVSYLKSSDAPFGGHIDNGQKTALIALLESVNTSDNATKKRLDLVESEVKKIEVK